MINISSVTFLFARGLLTLLMALIHNIFKSGKATNKMQEKIALDRVNKLEREIAFLKLELHKKQEREKIAKLAGLLKGLRINEADITKAKKSLFA